MTNKHVLGLIWAFLVALVVQFPLVFFSQIFETVDVYHHYQVTSAFSDGLSEGVFFPRWVASGNLGLGHPSLLSTYPLFYYVASIFHLLGIDLWFAMRLTSLIATAMTCFAGFYLFNRYLSLGWAFLGTIIVGTMPLMYWSLNYYNGFPWHFSFSFLLLFVGSSLLEKTEKIRFSLAFSMAGMALSHILTAYMACLCLPLAVIYRNYDGNIRQAINRLLMWGISCLIGLGLAMFYVFPALTTQNLVQFDSFFKEQILDWRNSFALPIISSWIYGTYWRLPQWIIPSATLMATIIISCLFYKIRLSRQEHNADRRFIISCLIVVFSSFFFSTDISYPIYVVSEHIRIVQRPIRFITIASVAMSLALPFAIAKARVITDNRFNYLLIIASVTLILLCSIQVFNNATGEKVVINRDIAYNKAPKQQNSLPVTAGSNWRKYVDDGGLDRECTKKHLSCKNVLEKSHERIWQISTLEDAVVRLPVFWFPAWVGYIDDIQTLLETDSITGLISVNLPAGDHEVKIKWFSLPQEKIGLWISISTLIGLLVLGLYPWLRGLIRR